MTPLQYITITVALLSPIAVSAQSGLDKFREEQVAEPKCPLSAVQERLIYEHMRENLTDFASAKIVKWGEVRLFHKKYTINNGLVKIDKILCKETHIDIRVRAKNHMGGYTISILHYTFDENNTNVKCLEQ